MDRTRKGVADCLIARDREARNRWTRSPMYETPDSQTTNDRPQNGEPDARSLTFARSTPRQP
jgi:hypothetical protein